jgi:hypothetical protein
VHFEGFAGTYTRTNDAWNYSNLSTRSRPSIAGNDTRNYFRSNIGEGRLFVHIDGLDSGSSRSSVVVTKR